MIQAFKLLKGLDEINYNNFFVVDVNISRRDHTLKVAKPCARLDIRLHSLAIESLIVGIIFRLNHRMPINK